MEADAGVEARAAQRATDLQQLAAVPGICGGLPWLLARNQLRKTDQEGRRLGWQEPRMIDVRGKRMSGPADARFV